MRRIDFESQFKNLRHHRRQALSGFTLIELIMVIVMLGVLSIFAAPRMFNSSTFYARGFHDETLALLRYAQKSAIAQRRTVCVAFTTQSATLTISSASATLACTTALPLKGPRGESPATVPSNTSRGVAYSSKPVDFNFDGLGQPITAAGAPAPTKIQVLNATNGIMVEAVTGYVHECAGACP